MGASGGRPPTGHPGRNIVVIMAVGLAITGLVLCYAAISTYSSS